MIRPILAYGNPILKQTSSKVDINREDISQLIIDMWETMYNANGVGLAAPQIGVLKQIFIADFDYFQEEESFIKSEIEKLQQVFINPIILDEFGDDFIFSEGCLSIPDISEEVIRKNNLTIKFLDEKFNQKKITCSGIIARVIQHEYDHLKGILFTDKISLLKKRELKGKLDIISAGDFEPNYKMNFYKDIT
ncbi:MAG TPA: peptide deformylase [Flavobacteriaceae bacterium]|nr:peptide deformylase [Flavobacteriaceae bacterium]